MCAKPQCHSPYSFLKVLLRAFQVFTGSCLVCSSSAFTLATVLCLDRVRSHLLTIKQLKRESVRQAAQRISNLVARLTKLYLLFKGFGMIHPQTLWDHAAVTYTVARLGIS